MTAHYAKSTRPYGIRWVLEVRREVILNAEQGIVAVQQTSIGLRFVDMWGYGSILDRCADIASAAGFLESRRRIWTRIQILGTRA